MNGTKIETSEIFQKFKHSIWTRDELIEALKFTISSLNLSQYSFETLQCS